MRAPRALSALVYGAALAAASLAGPAAAEWTAEDAERLQAKRHGAAATLILHDAPQEAVDVTVLDAEGREVAFSDLSAGGIAVVNLWATWCPPCRHEMPTLDRLHAAMRDADAPIVVEAVNIERRGRIKAGNFFDKTGVETLRVLSDEAMALPPALRLIGYPVTVVLDPQGREIARLQGDTVWDAPEMQEMLRAIAAAAGPDA